MTMPNGAGGLDADGWLSHWTVQNTASSLATRTQDNATAYYQNEVQGSPSWGAASFQFFDVILGGFKTLTDLLAGIVHAITGAAEGGLNAISTFLTDRWNDLATGLGQLAALAQNLLNAPAQVIGNLGHAIIDGIGNTIGGLLNGLFGALTGQQTGGGQQQTVTATADQIAALAATTAANAAAISQLQSDNDATNNNGMSGGDDFERQNSVSLGSDWLQRYVPGTDGVLCIANGHDAWWTTTGGSSGGCFAQRVNPVDRYTLSDYQIVRMTTTTPLIESPFFSDVPNNSLYGRVSDDGTRYVRAFISDSGAILKYANGGAEADLSPSVKTSQANGTTWALVCGTAGGLNVYRLLRNGTPIITYTDSALLVATGESCRGWGFGMGPGGFGSTQKRPSAVTGVTVADNFPIAASGTSFRAFRAGGATSGLASGNSVLPASTFNTLDYITPDMTYDAASNRITVSKSGTYLVAQRLQMSRVINGGETWCNSVWKKGAPYANGEGDIGIVTTGSGSNASSSNALTFFGGGPMVLYLNAGDDIQFAAVSNGGSVAVLGDAAGLNSWVSVTKIG